MGAGKLSHLFANARERLPFGQMLYNGFCSPAAPLLRWCRDRSMVALAFAALQRLTKVVWGATARICCRILPTAVQPICAMRLVGRNARYTGALAAFESVSRNDCDGRTSLATPCRSRFIYDRIAAMHCVRIGQHHRIFRLDNESHPIFRGAFVSSTAVRCPSLTVIFTAVLRIALASYSAAMPPTRGSLLNFPRNM